MSTVAHARVPEGRPRGVWERGFTMQEYGKKMGWTRAGLFLSALLLVVMGILCFVAHGIMPEPLHNTTLPTGYEPGALIGAVVMLILGVVELAAFKMGGGSKNLSGYMFLSGVYSLICVVAVLVDPLVGTLSYEWVIAVLIGLFGVILFIEAVFASRVIGYGAWALQMIIGLVMIVMALGVVYDSAMASTFAGISFILLAIEVALRALKSGDIKLAVAA